MTIALAITAMVIGAVVCIGVLTAFSAMRLNSKNRRNDDGKF